MTSEKNKVEALMFTIAKRIHIDEVSKITGIRNIDKIKAVLQELKTEYDAKGSSMILHDEGDGHWKLTVKDHYMSIVNKVVSQTELDRPLMETLAVIAWKYPVLQADVVKIRHNKAYEHLKRLDELGFVTRQRFGRTNKLTLTQKFFEYFQLPSKEQAKELFKEIIPEKVIEKIEKTEQEIDEAERKLEKAKRKKEEMEKAKKEAEEKDKKPSPEPGPHPQPPEPLPEAEPQPNPTEPMEPVPEAEVKKELEEVQKKEDKELEEIEKDIKDIEKEEDEESYSE